MLIEVTGPDVTVTDADDFTRLQIEATDAPSALEALSAASLLADEPASTAEAAWLRIDALRARAADAATTDAAEWSEKWDGMIAFAAKHGWVEKSALRSHIVAAV